jgi:hypothetical protein
MSTLRLHTFKGLRMRNKPYSPYLDSTDYTSNIRQYCTSRDVKSERDHFVTGQRIFVCVV